MLMLYATGNEQAKSLVDSTLAQLELPIDALYSTMGRTAARTLETSMMVDSLNGWFDQLLANIKAGDVKTFNEALWNPETWPKRAQGVGHMEAPRGALGHWIVIEDGKTANYQAVVPSTWNAGPRDGQNQQGPYEAALAGHALHDPEQPIEILRTIHSFDPCIACAVHLTDPDGEEVLSVKVR
jgi:hydrogenase large subunit